MYTSCQPTARSSVPRGLRRSDISDRVVAAKRYSIACKAAEPQREPAAPQAAADPNDTFAPEDINPEGSFQLQIPHDLIEDAKQFLLDSDQGYDAEMDPIRLDTDAKHMIRKLLLHAEHNDKDADYDEAMIAEVYLEMEARLAVRREMTEAQEANLETDEVAEPQVVGSEIGMANISHIDPDDLEKVQRWIAENELETYKGSWDPSFNGVPPHQAIQIIGLTTWRLGSSVDEPFHRMASNFEGFWRHMYPLGELSRYPFDRTFEVMDTMQSASTADADDRSFNIFEQPSPAQGEEGWPRLVVENRCYQTREFRKMHLELAVRQDGLQVLHMVMYPHYNYDIPILSADIVAVNSRVTLAIIDPCPVTDDRSLPPVYEVGVNMLQTELSSWIGHMPESLEPLAEARLQAELAELAAAEKAEEEEKERQAREQELQEQDTQEQQEKDAQVAAEESKLAAIAEIEQTSAKPVADEAPLPRVEDSSEAKNDEQGGEGAANEASAAEGSAQSSGMVPGIYDQLVLGLATQRRIPDWGKQIFSDYCICTRPNSASEVATFVRYAIALMRFHLHFAKNSEPVDADPNDAEGAAAVARIRAAHKRYCDKQLENTKTRRVLEKAFGDDVADRYMREMMFDYHE